MPSKNIKLVLLFSGKRKSGKDFITQKLHEKLKDKSQIIRISEPIKSEWAKRLNLNLNELLGDGPLKEKYRQDMIEWSDKIRAEDYGFFCREALKEADKEIILISDVRRKTDIKYFREVLIEPIKLRLIRINCSDEIRIKRGWKFCNGIDDVTSERDLDDFSEWDMIITNEDDNADEIVKKIQEKFEIS